MTARQEVRTPAAEEGRSGPYFNQFYTQEGRKDCLKAENSQRNAP
jgi:hypothetical protein